MPEQGFNVNDRRISHDQAESADAAPQARAQGQSTPEAGGPPAGGFKMSDSQGIDFTTFVISLAQSALIHMGLGNHPDTGKPEPNPQLARQNIDILGLLEEKTRGNLSEEEGDLLTQMLYTLRMRYVALAREGGSTGSGASHGG
ncbi:MAG: DUF1844 domain-containing protein [Nitrospirota bacterium]|nr:DUF1844 domain-containing protein [Nitrospirota bacterium]